MVGVVRKYAATCCHVASTLVTDSATLVFVETAHYKSMLDVSAAAWRRRYHALNVKILSGLSVQGMEHGSKARLAANWLAIENTTVGSTSAQKSAIHRTSLLLIVRLPPMLSRTAPVARRPSLNSLAIREPTATHRFLTATRFAKEYFPVDIFAQRNATTEPVALV
jgi:hypothetical protein